MDTLLDAAEIEQDDQERERFYLAAQQLAIDDGVLIPLYYDVSYTVVKPWVKGLTVSPVGILSLDRVWIER
jgi:peptide/nickel transport system substrate-binding protein/oligopeptide transport system substrate-binding protein